MSGNHGGRAGAPGGGGCWGGACAATEVRRCSASLCGAEPEQGVYKTGLCSISPPSLCSTCPHTTVDSATMQAPQLSLQWFPVELEWGEEQELRLAQPRALWGPLEGNRSHSAASGSWSWCVTSPPSLPRTFHAETGEVLGKLG